MELDRDVSTPLYIQLAGALRGQILSGEIPSRHALPSKKRLVQELGISTRTVDSAIGILKDEGLIEFVKGKGLYVRERPRSH